MGLEALDSSLMAPTVGCKRLGAGLTATAGCDL